MMTSGHGPSVSEIDRGRRRKSGMSSSESLWNILHSEPLHSRVLQPNSLKNGAALQRNPPPAPRVALPGDPGGSPRRRPPPLPKPPPVAAAAACSLRQRRRPRGRAEAGSARASPPPSSLFPPASSPRPSTLLRRHSFAGRRAGSGPLLSGSGVPRAGSVVAPPSRPAGVLCLGGAVVRGHAAALPSPALAPVAPPSLAAMLRSLGRAVPSGGRGSPPPLLAPGGLPGVCAASGRELLLVGAGAGAPLARPPSPARSPPRARVPGAAPPPPPPRVAVGPWLRHHRRFVWSRRSDGRGSVTAPLVLGYPAPRAALVAVLLGSPEWRHLPSSAMGGLRVKAKALARLRACDGDVRGRRLPC